MDNEKALVKTTGTQMELTFASNIIALTSKLLSRPFDAQKWWDSLDNEWKKVLLMNDAELLNQQKASLTSFRRPFRVKYSGHKASDTGTPQISAEQLVRITNLECLFFERWTPINTLEPIRNFANLERLFFNGTSITSLEPIRNLTTLKKLSCHENFINSLEPISCLTNLEVLWFDKTAVNSLEPIINLKNLEELWCSETTISSLEPIRNLANLKKLWCYKTAVNDLEPIRNLINLEELWCFKTTINSLDPIMNLPYLIDLNIKETNISRSEIEKFKRLHAECKIQCE